MITLITVNNNKVSGHKELQYEKVIFAQAVALLVLLAMTAVSLTQSGRLDRPVPWSRYGI